MRYDRRRVLLVDDNHHMRLILAEVLRAVVVREISEADEGAAAVALLRVRQVDSVIADLAMPGLGLPVLRGRPAQLGGKPFADGAGDRGQRELHPEVGARGA